MSIASSQRRVFLELHAGLKPHLRTDRNLPARIETALRSRKNLGSRDRRLYRELLYTLLRHLPWLEAEEGDVLAGRVAALCAETPATRSFKAELANPTGLEKLSLDQLLPAWIRKECPRAFEPDTLGAMLARAPLWFRLQGGEDAKALGILEAAGLKPERSAVLPGAYKLSGDTDLIQNDAYLDGLVEIQDLGSQLLLEACSPEAGGSWLDACAGAGGKTLQLSALLGPKGRVDAHDIRTEALEELASRAQRAGMTVDTGRKKYSGRRSGLFAPLRLRTAPDGLYDGVLVDAPCTGSGTWRRSPHLKWCTSPEAPGKAAELQRKLLGRFADHVRPGGLLLYATCSIFKTENQDLVSRFLDENKSFEPSPLKKTFGLKPEAPHLLQLLPGPWDNDGLFVAAFQRKA